MNPSARREVPAPRPPATVGGTRKQKTPMTRTILLPAWALAALLCGASAWAQSVTAHPAPHAGFRPRAVVDKAGVLHVVQGVRDRRGDLVYLRREPGSSRFSEPIPVNVTARIVAGFDVAVGKQGRVHVLMRTNPRYSKLMQPDAEKIGFFDLKYMLYARLNDAGDAFEPERNLAGETIGFEGAGTILADGKGRVLAFWHGQLEPEFDEPSRRIFRAESTDGGVTFGDPEAIRTEVEGACQCCAMAGAFDAQGRVVLNFRNSTLTLDGTRTKDSYALVSDDLGRSFEGILLEPWEEAGCPGSVGAVTSGPSGTYVAWRTRALVSMARLGAPGVRVSPGRGANTRIPVLVSNHRGEILMVWGASGGPGSKGAGDVGWQVFDREGAPISPKGVVENGVAQGWGAPAAYAKPDGSFVILYDGAGE